MPSEKDKSLTVKFLKCLSKVKGWSYHDKIEKEKKAEIKEFIAIYVFKNLYCEISPDRIYYNRLNFLINYPAFKPSFNALLSLLEISDNETEFIEHYQKVTIRFINGESNRC